jgi:hypothetical protein
MNLISQRRHEMHFPEEILDRVNVASAAVGLSSSEYITACLIAGLETHAQHDPIVATAFRVMGK